MAVAPTIVETNAKVIWAALATKPFWARRAPVLRGRRGGVGRGVMSVLRIGYTRLTQVPLDPGHLFSGPPQTGGAPEPRPPRSRYSWVPRW